jgi:hypothetical protein
LREIWNFAELAADKEITGNNAICGKAEFMGVGTRQGGVVGCFERREQGRPDATPLYVMHKPVPYFLGKLR